MAQYTGAGSIVVKGIDKDTGQPVPLYAIESVDFPGVYGLVVLNPDGTMLTTGGGGGASTGTFAFMDDEAYEFMDGTYHDFMDA